MTSTSTTIARIRVSTEHNRVWIDQLRNGAAAMMTDLTAGQARDIAAALIAAADELEQVSANA